MTDYRDTYNPSASQRGPYEIQNNNSGMGGIIIAVAVVAIVFLGLSMLSGPSIESSAIPGAGEQTDRSVPPSTPVAPAD